VRLRICIIGKFPPIQGGVSMRTYWSAHGLAARGHEVHVVTNAKEVHAPFRVYMRPEDWKRCEAVHGGGSVTVHWTDPVDSSQSYIPMASPFVSKLAAVAARVHAEHPFDVVYSHYLEPYGVAGYLAAQMTGRPHVVRMAGSDVGRLWRHPQLEPLYDHVLRSGEIVIAGGTVAERAVRRGVDPNRIALGGGFVVPEDVFTPEGPALDLAALRREVESHPDFRDLVWGDFQADRPYFGVCGKLGESKGTFALLAAMHRLKHAGVDAGLVALAHGQPAVEKSFRSRVQELGLTDRILQIPFLPHWRVPEFLRGCLAVCCLEQDFPISFHTPIIPREVVLCGGCLVGATEIVRKLAPYGRLPHGYGCVAIADVNDIALLSRRLAAIVDDPAPAAAVGARGCAFARELQRGIAFPETLERILAAAAVRRRPSRTQVSTERKPAESDRFLLTRLAAAAIAETDGSGVPQAADQTMDLARARNVLAAVERGIAGGKPGLQPLAPAVRVEIAIATAESPADESRHAADADPLFRVRIGRWAMEEGALATLVPVRDPQLHVLEFDYDVSALMGVRSAKDLPALPSARRSHIVAFGRTDRGPRNPLLVDALTAQILKLSDGTRTACEIADELTADADTAAKADNLKWIENLFVQGLISLQDSAAGAPRPE
jgi:glycosyltransferase involved in cell wall biosynthesis